MRDFAIALLCGFITGVAVTVPLLWLARDRIRERMIRKRRGS